MWPLGRSTDPSSDGTSSISSQMAMGGVAGGRPVVPPDSRAFSELLGSRLRTEDALQVSQVGLFCR